MLDIISFRKRLSFYLKKETYGSQRTVSFFFKDNSFSFFLIKSIIEVIKAFFSSFIYLRRKPLWALQLYVD